VLNRLRCIPGLLVSENVPLASCTRFAIGGPAWALADASTEAALAAALRVLRASETTYTVIGGGSNLIASDEGFPGVVLRYTNATIEFGPSSEAAKTVRVRAAAGALLQDLVDRAIKAGLAGIETLTGIPGWVGGAIYGNAGAYGHSMHERVIGVRYLNAAHASSGPRALDNVACEFRYRDSVFKREKDWIVLEAELELDRGSAEDLARTAAGIRQIRDEKYPPTMRCAGSIFKNLLLAELPEPVRAQVSAGVIREGKVPAAYFLDQAGAKGLARGGVKVASYHANLIYNEGGGTASDLRKLIAELQRRVAERFGIVLEEEVQHI